MRRGGVRSWLQAGIPAGRRQGKRSAVQLHHAAEEAAKVTCFGEERVRHLVVHSGRLVSVSPRPRAVKAARYLSKVQGLLQQIESNSQAQM
ncbi:MAG: hypothetical protein QI223_01735 [Candidatus Korarchaeota archaeon]|nr:hypothetical protein [Candidatus Korarchaeota archaeon]